MPISWSKLSKPLRMMRLYRNWTVALRNRLEGTSAGGEVVYELRSGPLFRMEAGQHDVRVLNEIWLDRVYERLGDFRVRDGWTVVDLGAHKGAFTVRAALSGKRTTVHAVEPAPENLACLRRNLELNGASNVCVHEGAVGPAAGVGLLGFDAADSGRGSIVVDRGHPDAMVVPTMPLADLIAAAGSEVDLLKMDVEGAEYDVLREAPASALASVRRIVLEYHASGGRTAIEVLETLRLHLEKHRFQCVEARERSLLFATKGGLESRSP